MKKQLSFFVVIAVVAVAVFSVFKLSPEDKKALKEGDVYLTAPPVVIPIPKREKTETEQ